MDHGDQSEFRPQLYRSAPATERHVPSGAITTTAATITAPAAHAPIPGTAKAIVIDELLFVDASAGRAPRSLSAFGPQLNDNPYAVANSHEVSTWSVSPYLRRRLGPTADLTARYTVDEVDAGKNAFGSSQGNTLDLRLASGSIFHTLGWGLSYRRQEIDAAGAGSDAARKTPSPTSACGCRAPSA